MMAGPNGFHSSAGLDAFDDLADAFLGGPSGLAVDASDEAGNNTLQVKPHGKLRILLQGHLPGRASLWAGPATQALADYTQKAFLLIRLAGENLGEAQVDLVHPSSRQGPSIAPEAEASDFAVAVKSGLGQAAGVVLCVMGEDLAAKQASLLLSLDDLIKSGACEVTVLTGADDASCIAAYKLMKSVAEALGGNSDALADAKAAQVHMSVSLSGASPAKADEAFARMADAARQFLAHSLGRGPDVPKLVGMHSQSLHDRTTEHLVLEARLSSLRDQLKTWLHTQSDLTSSHPASSDRTESPSSMNKAATSSSHVSVVGRPIEWSGHLDVSSGDPIAQVKLVMDDRGVMRPATGTTPVAPASTAASTPAVASTPAPDSIPALASTPTPAPAPARGLHVPSAPASTSSPASSGMMFPGLTALNFRCPFEKSAILAVDESGTLQVLVSHSEPANHAVVDPAASRIALAEATHRLITVGGWLCANSELLALISAGKINTASKPILHLLTDHPACVRRLLDTDIRVHLVIDTAKLKQGAMAIALN